MKHRQKHVRMGTAHVFKRCNELADPLIMSLIGTISYCNSPNLHVIHFQSIAPDFVRPSYPKFR